MWEAIHQPQPQLTDTPWSRVIAKAVAPDRRARYATATALARALEEVTLRAAGDDDAKPYPGLAAFEEKDAVYFFGRELEVEALLKKLRRPQLLAVIGPSGAGKSSFLRAGLLPSLPPSWGAIVFTPGNRPFAALARALAEVLPGDQETVSALRRIDEPDTALELISSWRAKQQRVLLVLDQFEELFTQNPPPAQTALAELLGRLPVEADVHVLLSMRDDFLFHCEGFESLRPIFSELTPIGAPTGAALRRAIVQPALKCGYRFEDESLIEEMLAEVEGERGSLPTVAFAAARVWEMRDRDQGLLTREAYVRIGGVGGALAQHAEQTLEAIGGSQVPVVRELFRNLVTAQGTRATRDRQELLSVFSGSDPLQRSASVPAADEPTADAVLDALIDARLLTSYEVHGTEAEERRTRVEIIHESLLSNWPRLVRWRTQDADSAQLRDQLRQAAQSWAKRDKPTDLLWSGTSYQEFELWRQRYPGGLTEAEEEFAHAMTAHAERRKRRRRLTIATVIALLVIGLGIVGSFWRQAATARDRALQETLRAEANQLLALGRLEIDVNPTGALAFALASLERADDPVTRLFALEILERGPTAFILDPAYGVSVDFSPDGRWLVSGVGDDGSLKLWSSSGEAKLLGTHDGPVRRTRFGPDSNVVVSLDWNNDVARIWSIPDGKVIRSISPGENMDIYLVRSLRRLLTFAELGSRTRIQAWPLDGGEPELYGDVEMGLDGWYYQMNSWGLDVDPAGRRLAYVPIFDSQIRNEAAGTEVRLLALDGLDDASPRLVGRHSEFTGRLSFHPRGRQLASASRSGEIRIWDLEQDSPRPVRTLRQTPGLARSLAFDATGSRLASATDGREMALWSLDGPPDAEPTLLPLGDTGWVKDAAFHPDGDWLATASSSAVRVWPIQRRYPLAFKGHDDQIMDMVFLPDGESIASASQDGTVRLWPLSLASGGGSRTLFDIERDAGGSDVLFRLAVDATGTKLLTGSSTGRVFVVPLDGGRPRELAGFGSHIAATALGPDGRLAAAAGRASQGDDAVIRVWDLDNDTLNVFGEDGGQFAELRFTLDGRLVSAGELGIRIWDLADGSHEVVSDRLGEFDLTPDGRFLIAALQGEDDEAVVYDLERGTREKLEGHGPAWQVGLGREGRIAVTFWLDPSSGTSQVRVGRRNGGPPHLIAGPTLFKRPAVSPDGKWIAALNDTNAVRLWPMPDLSRPPLHTLPHEDVLATLHSLTNLRVVPDAESQTGWGWSLDTFRGWQEVPTW